MNKLILLAILGIILGFASPFLLLLHHVIDSVIRMIIPGISGIAASELSIALPIVTGIISVVLMLSACLGSMKKGSKEVGIIAMVYGALATLAGAVVTYACITATSQEFKAFMGTIVPLGASIVLFIGVIVLMFGYKTFRAFGGET